MTALIYDCDGVLADTERYGHLALSVRRRRAAARAGA